MIIKFSYENLISDANKTPPMIAQALLEIYAVFLQNELYYKSLENRTYDNPFLEVLLEILSKHEDIFYIKNFRSDVGKIQNKTKDGDEYYNAQRYLFHTILEDLVLYFKWEKFFPNHEVYLSECENYELPQIEVWSTYFKYINKHHLCGYIKFCSLLSTGTPIGTCVCKYPGKEDEYLLIGAFHPGEIHHYTQAELTKLTEVANYDPERNSFLSHGLLSTNIFPPSIGIREISLKSIYEVKRISDSSNPKKVWMSLNKESRIKLIHKLCIYLELLSKGRTLEEIVDFLLDNPEYNIRIDYIFLQDVLDFEIEKSTITILDLTLIPELSIKGAIIRVGKFLLPVGGKTLEIVDTNFYLNQGDNIVLNKDFWGNCLSTKVISSGFPADLDNKALKIFRQVLETNLSEICHLDNELITQLESIFSVIPDKWSNLKDYRIKKYFLYNSPLKSHNVEMIRQKNVKGSIEIIVSEEANFFKKNENKYLIDNWLIIIKPGKDAHKNQVDLKNYIGMFCLISDNLPIEVIKNYKICRNLVDTVAKNTSVKIYWSYEDMVNKSLSRKLRKKKNYLTNDELETFSTNFKKSLNFNVQKKAHFILNYNNDIRKGLKHLRKTYYDRLINDLNHNISELKLKKSRYFRLINYAVNLLYLFLKKVNVGKEPKSYSFQIIGLIYFLSLEYLARPENLGELWEDHVFYEGDIHRSIHPNMSNNRCLARFTSYTTIDQNHGYQCKAPYHGIIVLCLLILNRR